MSREVEEYWATQQSRRVTPAENVLDSHRRTEESLATAPVQGYVRGFMRDVADKAYEEGGDPERRLAFQNMFWPAPDAKSLCGLLRKQLFAARTYQVTGEMTDAVTGTYRATAGQIGHIQEEELPSEAGFAWLDKPFLSTDGNGKSVTNRAVSWSPQAITYPDGATYPGLRVTAWYGIGDYDDYSDLRDAETVRYAAPLILAHTSVLPFGQRFGGHPADGFDMSPDDFLHWVHVLWAFMGMEVVTDREAPLPRPARRRAEKWRKGHPTVNVIMLRRAASRSVPEPGDAERRQPDWTCQWVVQGHHRHLESYAGPRHHAVPAVSDRGACASCGSRVTWVKPYLKGPDGLPLRSADQLYRLSR